MYKSKLNKFIIFLALIAVFTVSAYGYLMLMRHNEYNSTVFSHKTMMMELWNAYKKEYLEAGTFRTIDKQRDNITTSEGQSYTLLRAVMMDDKAVFDASLQWTKDNLNRTEDNLFAWLFGQNSDGSWGVLKEQGGYNTATDADVDIALALIFAYSRWSDEAYLKDAKGIIQDVWANEVVPINGEYYLAANNIEILSESEIIVNPSYLAPYAYKIFAKLDPDRPWLALADSSYRILERSSTSFLDKNSSSGLFPDWIFIDRLTGEIRNSYSERNLTSNYSYDAMRTPWRLAVDYVWFNDERAKEVMSRLSFLDKKWREENRLYSTYSHDGQVLVDHESNAMYGTFLSYYIVMDKGFATDLYLKKVEPLYSSDTNRWTSILSYYDDNWVWFGMGLYTNEFKNLSTNLFD